jgi:hypothetical protein
MIREMLTGVVIITLFAGTAAVASDEPVFEPEWNRPSARDSCGCSVDCESDSGFVHRLFNFRPWNVQSRSAQTIGTPGLPRGRRYYGGRYFGQFNNRFYGPQYGNF